VKIDHARHDDVAARIQRLRGCIAPLQIPRGADVEDPAPVYRHTVVLKNPPLEIHRDDGPVVNERIDPLH
jgi:hypothetical protein